MYFLTVLEAGTPRSGLVSGETFVPDFETVAFSLALPPCTHACVFYSFSKDLVLLDEGSRF